MTETTTKEVPAEVRSEMDRIKRLFAPSDGDREDLVTYAKEVARLRARPQ